MEYRNNIKINKSNPLIGEYLKIADDNILTVVLSIMENVPEHFYLMPSSKFHHPLDERGRGGLALHTRRVVWAVESICESRRINGVRKDLLISSAILHDIAKFGLGETPLVKIDKLHPKVAADFIRPHSEEIAELVLTHMGYWGNEYGIPEPITEDGWFLHYADCVVTNVII